MSSDLCNGQKVDLQKVAKAFKLRLFQESHPECLMIFFSRSKFPPSISLLFPQAEARDGQHVLAVINGVARLVAFARLLLACKLSRAVTGRVVN